MARFESEATDRYPMFEKGLHQDFVNVVSNQRIINAFWKWSHFAETANTRSYFKYGTPPTIGVISQDCDYRATEPLLGFYMAKHSAPTKVANKRKQTIKKSTELQL
jgi:hypothetical protein